MRPPPSEGVWYNPSTGTLSTTAVSCFNTSSPRNRYKEQKSRLGIVCALCLRNEQQESDRESLVVVMATRVKLWQECATVVGDFTLIL